MVSRRERWSQPRQGAGRHILSILAPCLFAFLVFAVPSFGQTGAGSLRVLVKDPSGAIVPDASVQLMNVGTGVTTMQNSNSAGYAVFPSLERGTYNVDVSKAGFSTLKIAAITIDVNQNREVAAELRVAATTTEVQVQADVVALQTASSSVGAVVTGNQITSLPLAERRYTDLTLLSPGA